MVKIVIFRSGQAGFFGLGLGSYGLELTFLQAQALSPDPGQVGSGLGSRPRLDIYSVSKKYMNIYSAS